MDHHDIFNCSVTKIITILITTQNEIDNIFFTTQKSIQFLFYNKLPTHDF